MIVNGTKAARNRAGRNKKANKDNSRVNLDSNSGRIRSSPANQDKAKDTPYHTYLDPGLPAGPISNPGLASINACITPQKSDYYFFFADAQKVTRYAKTYAEHLSQQQRYGLAPD